MQQIFRWIKSTFCLLRPSVLRTLAWKNMLRHGVELPHSPLGLYGVCVGGVYLLCAFVSVGVYGCMGMGVLMCVCVYV